MPELNWNETDFMECLEVVPEIESYKVKHVYKVTKDGLALVVIVRQFESVVQLSLRQREVDTLLIEFSLFVRESTRYIKDKRSEYLEFQDCIVLPSRFSYQDVGNMFDKANFKHGLTVQLAIKPHIQIRHV